LPLEEANKPKGLLFQASLHLLGDLENSQQTQGTQNADPKGCARSEEPPEYLKNAPYYHLEGNQELHHVQKYYLKVQSH